ncbi:MAG: hypothetical protein CL610_06480 [Anaerolineaceae bacterium]|nr:hypothetical protein [Anaerolineaceae bacterium]
MLLHFILTGLGIALSTVTVTAQASNDRIVFMSDRDGNREIYTMNPDGTDVQRLTNNEAQDLQPTWSPDKSQIAFVSNRDGYFAVYIMNAAGSNQRQISTDQFAYHEYPAWSPDGQYLAYASDRSGNFDIYIAEISGSNPRQLTKDDGDETEPSWSPDGRQIAYLQNVDGAFEIFLVGTNGDTPQRLTQSEGGDYFSPRWSPDGTQLAYVLTVFDQAGNNSEIYAINMTSGEERLLVSRENSFIQSIAWSEDVQEIVYQVKEANGIWNLHRLNVNDGTFGILTDLSYNSETPAWFTPQSDNLVTVVGAITVTLRQPNDVQNASNYPSIWDGLTFQDLQDPGVATYQRVVNISQIYRWAFTWCGNSPSNLRAILEPLNVSMLVNGNRISPFLTYNTGNCQGWVTLVSDWPSDEQVLLEIQYDLLEPINDGQATYQAGHYEQKVYVTGR